MSYATAHERRAPAALAAAGVQLILAFLIVRGLAARYYDPETPAQAPNLVVVPTAERPPQPPPPPPEGDASGEGAPPALRAVPRPQEAPPAKMVIAEPRPVPSQAGSGTASSVGLAPVGGAGDGRGGAGNGVGSGTGGSGSGAGAASPPQRIAGSLSDRDYPRSAALRGAAGTVAISFRIGVDGAVTRCAVTGSSGDAELDRLTCGLVERRFRYRPARSAAGDPVETTLRTTFTWGTYRN